MARACSSKRLPDSCLQIPEARRVHDDLTDRVNITVMYILYRDCVHNVDRMRTIDKDNTDKSKRTVRNHRRVLSRTLRREQRTGGGNHVHESEGGSCPRHGGPGLGGLRRVPLLEAPG